MPGYTGNPALYGNPKTALEMMQELKGSMSQEHADTILSALEGLTERDVLFYSLGKVAGHKIATDAFEKAFFTDFQEVTSGPR